MKIGAHLWISEGIENMFKIARYLKCDCMQIFLHNPRRWSFPSKSNNKNIMLKKCLEKEKISPFVIHMRYLLNLSSPEKEVSYHSLKILEKEIEESEEIGADYYVIHPGSHKGAGKVIGLKNLVENLKCIKNKKTKILIENTSGQKNSIGSKWEEFSYLLEKIGDKIGFCFDTAHAFESGYNIREKEKLEEMLEEIDKNLSLRYILLIHANDSGTKCGSKIDRHQHIGKGFLGEKTFELLIKNEYLGKLPFIIETPYTNLESDKTNLEILREIGKKYGKI